MRGTRCTALKPILILTLLAPFPASATRKSEDHPPRPELLQRLLDCSTINDGVTRLTCFDRQSAALDEATRKNEIIVADPQAVQRAKRGLFGFSTPIVKLMGFGGNEDEAHEIKEVITTVESARHNTKGWLLTFADSSTWEQNDTGDFALSPKPGNEARITRGVLGTYFVSVRGQTPLKMRRIQ